MLLPLGKNTCSLHALVRAGVICVAAMSHVFFGHTVSVPYALLLSQGGMGNDYDRGILFAVECDYRCRQTVRGCQRYAYFRPAKSGAEDYGAIIVFPTDENKNQNNITQPEQAERICSCGITLVCQPKEDADDDAEYADHTKICHPTANAFEIPRL